MKQFKGMLTEKQIAAIRETCVKWENRILDTTSTDCGVIADLVRRSYQSVNADEAAVVFTASPHEAAMACVVLLALDNISKSDIDKVVINAEKRESEYDSPGINEIALMAIRSLYASIDGHGGGTTVREFVAGTRNIDMDVNAMLSEIKKAYKKTKPDKSLKDNVRQVPTVIQSGEIVRGIENEEARRLVIHGNENDITGIKRYLYLRYTDTVIRNMKSSVADVFRGSTIMNIGHDETKELHEDFIYSGMNMEEAALFDYMKNTLDLDMPDILNIFTEHENVGGWWIPREGVAFVSDRPVRFNIEHSDGERRANGIVEYSDENGVYLLNSITVPRWIGLPSSTDIDVKRIAKISNVDVRREFVSKVGIARVCQKLDCEVIDKKTVKTNAAYNKSLLESMLGRSVDEPETNIVYELILLNIGDGNKRPYLKMENPNPKLKGVFHVEGVPPGTKTVDEALKFRNGTSEFPDTLR